MHLFCVINGQSVAAPIDEQHPQVIVGRHRDCDMTIKSPRISRRHCQIKWTPDGISIKDLGSSGGTHVGDRKIGRARIKPGDRIRIADVDLELRDGPAPRNQAPQAPTEALVEDAPPQTTSAVGGWELHYANEDGAEQVATLEAGSSPLILGRKADCSIRLVNPTVGRHHCRVSLENGELVAKDLESSNGTFINGEKIRRGKLKDGDVLECGTAEVKIRAIAAQEIEEVGAGDTWSDEVFEEDMGPPNWFLIFTDDEGRVTTVEMAMKLRVLAMGEDEACEICVKDRGMEGEHIEMTWEYGVLVVRDLGTAVGTLLNGRSIDEVVLRNGDVITCGDFQVHVVRGSSGEVARASTGTRSGDADFWAPILTRHEDGLSMTYIDTDPYEESRKRELTIWGDGEASLELITRGEKESLDARVSGPLLDALFDALVRAGFPDVVSAKLDDGEDPAELELYLDSEASNVTLSRRVVERSSVYKEVAHLLDAVLAQIRG